MANDEVIGGIAISVTGDFSDLDAAFEAAKAQALSDSQAMAQAIQSAMSAPDVSNIVSGFAQLSDATKATVKSLDDYAKSAADVITEQAKFDQQLTDAQGTFAIIQKAFEEGAVSANVYARAAEQLSAAFDQANPAIEKSTEATHGAGAAAHEAEGGFAAMGEALIGIGEALKVTEGLVELGAEALHAADNVTRASIALTAITGSGEAAKGTIEGLEKLGISDGLSFPALLTAGTRMQQLLPEGTDVAAVLAKIADGAAVMGTDIGTAATKFDMLASSGNASGKSLLALGLNMDQLAGAINTLNPALITTEMSAKQVFAALDPGDRIKVLKEALDGLAGTAQKVAEQTFGGQWQILVNQWDAVLVEAGKALMPVITALTSFVRVDILPFLKNLVDDFNALPGPVKDAAVALGIAVAAIAPLTVAIGGFGVSISAISSVLPMAAKGFDILAGAMGVAELSLSEILIPLGLVAAAIAGLAAIHMSGADQEMATFAENVKDDFSGIADLFTGVKASIESFFSGLAEGAQSSLKPFEDQVESAWKILSDGVGSAIQPVTDALTALWESFKSSASEAATAALGKVGEALDQVAAKAKPATDALSHVQEVLTETTPKQEAFIAGVTAGDPSLRQFAEALAAVSNALDFLGGHYQTMTDAMTKGNPMMKENATNMHNLAEEAMKAAGLYDKHTESIQIHTAAVQKDTPEVIKLAQATHDLGDFTIAALDPMQRQAAAADALATKLASLAGSEAQANANMLAAQQALKDIQLQYDANEVGIDKLVEAQQRFIKAAADAKAATEAFTNAQIAAAKGFSDFNTALSQASPAYKSADDALKTLHDTLKLIGDDATAAPAKMTPLNQALADMGGAASKAKNAIEDLHTPITKLVDDFAALVTAAKASSDWSDVIKNLDEVDKRINGLAKTDLPAAEDQLAKFIDGMIKAGAPAELVQGQIDKLQQIVQKMASEGLPQATKGWQDLQNILKQVPAAMKDIQQSQEQQIDNDQRSLDLMKQRGDGMGYVLDQQAKLLQEEITYGEKTGKNVEAQIAGLESVRLKQEAIKIQTHGLADTYVDMTKELNSAFDQIGKNLADVIVNGKNFGDVMGSMFKKLAQDILGTLIDGALKPLKKELLDLESNLFDKLNPGLADTSKGIGDLSTASSGAAKSATDLSSTTQAVTKTMSSFGSLLNTITGIISAGAAVAGDIILSHISSDTGHIEVNTRETFAQVTNIWNDLKSDFSQTYTRQGEMLDRLNRIMDLTAIIAAAGGGSGMPPASLDKLNKDGDSTVIILGNIYGIQQDALKAAQTTANDIAWVMNDADNIWHTLGEISTTLTEMYDVLLYGKSFGQSSALASANQSAMQTHALNSLVTESITGNGQGRQIVDNTGQTASDAAALYGPLQAQANAAADALRHAGNTEAQLAALRAEEAAYANLANQAHMQGDEALAQSYQITANNLAAQISSITHVGTAALVSALGATDMSLVDASKGVQFSTLAGAQLISTTVAQGSMLVATSVSNALSSTAAASASFMASMASSLINIKGSNSSAGPLPSQQISLNSQGAPASPSVRPPDNGLPPIPVTGHMGYATGGSIETDQVAQLHAGEVVLPATQVAASAAQMTAQAQQIADLQAQLAGLNKGLMGSLANANVGDSEEAQKEINVVQAKLDALTTAMQANTAATQTDSTDGGASGSTASSSDSLDKIAALMQEQVSAQQVLANAQKTGNDLMIKMAQDNLDQINQQMAGVTTKQIQSEVGTPPAADATSAPTAAQQYTQFLAASGAGAPSGGGDLSDMLASNAQKAAQASMQSGLGAQDTGLQDATNSDLSGFDFSGLSSGGGFMDTSGIIAAIQEGTATLDADLHQVSVEIMALAAHVGGAGLVSSIGGAQKWGVATPKSFDTGGFVDQDQMAMVHAGEFVVPPDITGMLRSMASAPRAGYGLDPSSGGGSNGGGGGNVVINAPITISGVVDGRQLCVTIEQHLKRVLSRTGKYTK